MHHLEVQKTDCERNLIALYFSTFDMMLKANLCVYSFAVLVQCYSFKSAYKNAGTDSTVICVPCMLQHVYYEPFSLKNCRFGRYLMLIG